VFSFALQECDLAAKLFEFALSLRLLAGQFEVLQFDGLPQAADLQLHQASGFLLRAAHMCDLLYHLPLMDLLLPSQLCGLLDLQLVALVVEAGDLIQQSLEFVLVGFLLSAEFGSGGA
jgi:hypothetical protein